MAKRAADGPPFCVGRAGGKRCRGAEGKTPFAAAVQTSGQGHPQRIKLSVVKGFRKSEIRKWAQRHLSDGTHAVSDGLRRFDAVAEAGCAREAVISGGGRAAVGKDEFYWVSTALGSLKTALRSSCHSFDAKYAQRCLAEFEYRFNRRYRLADRVPRLAFVALRTPPMPERLLKHGLCQVVIRSDFAFLAAASRCPDAEAVQKRPAVWHATAEYTCFIDGRSDSGAE